MAGSIIHLKKCPFCGGPARLIIAPDNQKNDIPCYSVSCKRCHTMIGSDENGQTDFFRTPYDAVVAWNSREDDE